MPHLCRLLPAAHYKGQGALLVHRQLIRRLKVEVKPARLLAKTREGNLLLAWDWREQGAGRPEREEQGPDGWGGWAEMPERLRLGPRCEATGELMTAQRGPSLPEPPFPAVRASVTHLQRRLGDAVQRCLGGRGVRGGHDAHAAQLAGAQTGSQFFQQAVYLQGERARVFKRSRQRRDGQNF